MGDYGILVNPPLALQRKNFREMCRLLGVNVKYRYPLANKQYNIHGELETNYSFPEVVSGVFNEQITQKTSKLLGWNAELDNQPAVIHLPYDLHDLQVGCLIDIPSAFDGAPARTFRIVEISAIQIYPASVACKVVPEYETTLEKDETEFFENSNFNLLNEENSRVKYMLKTDSEGYIKERYTVITSEGAVINPEGFIHNGLGRELVSDEMNGRQIWV